MKKPYAETRFKTDTATIAIFDPSALAHRAADVADWWSVPSDELFEINKGNVIFVGLGADGVYGLSVFKGIGSSACRTDHVSAFITVQSGCIFIGAGEQVPGGDFGPETVYGGALVCAERGTCEVRLFRPAPGNLVVEYEHSESEASNQFEASPQIAANQAL